MGRDDLPNGSNLPAPYRNPWSQLAGNLRAVVADLRLRGQELLRRNGDGDLWRPGWWPRDLAPLFWPLLLLTLLTLSGGGSLALRAVLTPRPAAVDAPAGVEAPAAEIAVAPTERPAPSVPDLTAIASATPGPPTTPEPPAMPAPPVAAPDPLAPLLEAADAPGLVLAAEQKPARSLVVLTLTPAFAALAAPERQKRAEHWQELASGLGYEHLELRDRHADLLGRDALVGAGMILFSPPPPA